MSKCEQTLKKNQKQINCKSCFDLLHVKCLIFHAHHDFYYKDHELFSSSENPSNISATLDPGPDEHLQSLIMRPKHLKVMHLNTKSMVSAFDELLLKIKQYPFDVISMSETWLKENPLLLKHVTILGYNCEFRSRNSIRGGGVGAYIKETPTYKRRSDIEAKELDLEHLWLEFPGRNKHSKLFVGTIIPHTDVLPCPPVSDHDAVYATINTKVTRLQIRHKFIRNLKNFDESSFIEDFETLPFAASFAVSDPDEKLEILSSLL
ncbi:unnamed protein product [Pocillopora meandrina]|uniref:Endonuclease/exonuclease/phosphatase domain-containing protein n=1 Tax=Pocillopora meandrina TaxID=46732 RepID=A0AAU9XHY2_9CNID|nr:unnamed protein product [Pocillopora meandrina]